MEDGSAKRGDKWLITVLIVLFLMIAGLIVGLVMTIAEKKNSRIEESGEEVESVMEEIKVEESEDSGATEAAPTVEDGAQVEGMG